MYGAYDKKNEMNTQNMSGWFLRVTYGRMIIFFRNGLHAKMNGVFADSSALKCYSGPGTTCSIEINFDRNHVPGVGSTARTFDLQSSALPLCHCCPSRERQRKKEKDEKKKERVRKRESIPNIFRLFP